MPESLEEDRVLSCTLPYWGREGEVEGRRRSNRTFPIVPVELTKKLRVKTRMIMWYIAASPFICECAEGMMRQWCWVEEGLKTGWWIARRQRDTNELTNCAGEDWPGSLKICWEYDSIDSNADVYLQKRWSCNEVVVLRERKAWGKLVTLQKWRARKIGKEKLEFMSSGNRGRRENIVNFSSWCLP